MKSYSKVQAFSLAALILSAGLIWIWFSRIPQDQIHKEKILVPKAGFQAPYLVLSTLDGDQIDSNDLSGRPYILNFWASWCPPCKAEMPDLQKVSDEFSDTGLLIIAINASNQDIIQNVKDFVKRENISFLIPLEIGRAHV